MSVNIYLPGTSPVHRLDARVKILLLLAFSVAVFFVETWTGLGLLCAALAVAIVLSDVPLSRMGLVAVPVLALLVIVLACNSLVNVDSGAAFANLQGVSAGFAAGWESVRLVGSVGFSPDGFMRGLFYVVRILAITWASFVVTFTTTSNQLTDAFSSLLGPLRPLRFPVDDAAMVASLALRFIPLVVERFDAIRLAQVSRGASFGTGSLWQKVMGYSSIFVPLFISLFRQADRLADAMESRCYGRGERSQLNPLPFSLVPWALLVVCLVAFVACAIVF